MFRKDMDDCKILRGLPLSSVVCFVSAGGEIIWQSIQMT